VGGQDAEAAVEGWVMGGLSQNEAESVPSILGDLLAAPNIGELVRYIFCLTPSNSLDVVLKELWNNGKPLTGLFTRLQQLKRTNSSHLDRQLDMCRSSAADRLQQLLHVATCAELPRTAIEQLRTQFQSKSLLYSGSHLEEICLRELQVVFASEHQDYLATPVSGSDDGPVGDKNGLILARGLRPAKDSRETDIAITNVSGMDEFPIPRLMDEFGRNPTLETLVSLLAVDVCLARGARGLTHSNKLKLVGTTLQNYSKSNPPRRVVVIFNCHSGTPGNSLILQDLFTQCCNDDTLKDHMGVTLFIVGLDASQLVEYASLLTHYNFVSRVLCQTATL
jgi:hypothetical protein